ncbi:MAG TPA: site-2 protease family protein [Patescibacteria group bacterium]|nr:site-2 protease family protein [Patescibacteria group bacterium]
MDFGIGLIFTLPILLYSAILHEIAHGLIADRLGDPTARLSGRLTLNPIKHIDPFMTILLPLLLIFSGSSVIFGGAKPVPIDPYNLKDGKKDIALVALAGPLTNMILAAFAALLYHGFFFLPSSFFLFPFLNIFLQVTITINLYLAIFNLLPIPPLDGSKVFALILPDGIADSYLSIGTIGVVILFLLLSFPVAGFYLPDFMQHIYILLAHLLGL